MKWKTIWENRKLHSNETLILDELLYADGFDCGAGKFDSNIWLKYIDSILDKINIDESATFFEIGCGAGAFLYPLYNKKYLVSGIDFSALLINKAKEVMPDMIFNIMNANKLDIKIKYDIILSNSVFQYFDDLNYAKEVIGLMIKKSNKRIIILDINDKDKELTAHSIRRGAVNKEEYDEKYKELNHLFYEKQWFKEIAIKNNCSIEIYEQNIEGYLNGSFRYNVFMEKLDNE